MTEGLEQKIDKLMVVMHKLEIKAAGQNRQFELQVYQTNRGREVFKIGLVQTVAGAIHLEEGQGMDKNIKVGQHTTQIIGKLQKQYER